MQCGSVCQCCVDIGMCWLHLWENQLDGVLSSCACQRQKLQPWTALLRLLLELVFLLIWLPTGLPSAQTAGVAFCWRLIFQFLPEIGDLCVSRWNLPVTINIAWFCASIWHKLPNWKLLDDECNYKVVITGSTNTEVGLMWTQFLYGSATGLEGWRNLGLNDNVKLQYAVYYGCTASFRSSAEDQEMMRMPVWHTPVPRGYCSSLSCFWFSARVTGGNPPPPYPFTFPSSTLRFIFCFSLFLLASSIFLLFCPFPFYQSSPRVQAGCCRSPLNLALVFLCWFYVICIFELWMHACFCRIWFSFVLWRIVVSLYCRH